jgi:hypothetical protein
MYGLSSLFPSPFSVARTGLPSLSFLHVRGPQWPAVATYISGSDLDQVSLNPSDRTLLFCRRELHAKAFTGEKKIGPLSGKHLRV